MSLHEYKIFLSLNEYKKKRDFRRTREPAPGKAARTSAGPLIFCVQKHAASHLHYDLRLEMQGVLKSWAVPKGPSMNPADRRLAMKVEDHPLEYANFEGTIPEGNYGAGTVELWDRGEYRPVGGLPPEEQLAEGKLVFQLEGRRLRGEFALVRMKQKTRGKSEPWLLLKHRDEFAGDPAPDGNRHWSKTREGTSC